jgi:hypothetical protein
VGAPKNEVLPVKGIVPAVASSASEVTGWDRTSPHVSTFKVSGMHFGDGQLTYDANCTAKIRTYFGVPIIPIVTSSSFNA